MSCDETRDRLEEYRRGELAPDEARAVEAHLAGCPDCRAVRDRDDALAALLRGLPRTAAPDALRRAIAGAGRPAGRAWLARPWVTAALAAAAVLLLLLPWIEFRPERAPDPVETLLRSGVEEHRRIVLEAEAASAAPDPAPLFERVRTATGIQLPPVMAGVGELKLLVARPTMLGERKTAAAALRYPASPVTTYFLLPGRDLPVPDQHRVQIEQYRPYMRRLDDFNVVYWKQGDVAYLMVSGLEDEPTRKLFLKMRQAL